MKKRGGALAYPGTHFNLQELVEKADVIAAVDISKIDGAGRSTITLNGRSLSANVYRADVHVERRIKGICPDEFILDFFNTTAICRISRSGAGV
jgi:hypothetical protein